MVFINNFLLQLVEPNGLWDIILKWVDSFTHNFGWTILIFTLIIKIVMSPLDFYNRYSTRKNTLIQKKLAPQVEKLNKTYVNRKDIANQQVNALYKKEGYNMIGSCLFMLINLVLTMVVFFTIFSSIRNMSSYKMINQYNDLQNIYISTEGSIEQKQTAVITRYEEIKDDWLWISNIWRPDSNSKPIPTYAQLVSLTKNSKAQYKDAVASIDEGLYNEVTAGLVTKYENKWNGYFILAILALVTSFASQALIDMGNKVKKNKDNPEVTITAEATNTTMKTMKFILPVIMVVFVLTNTAAFGIYIVVSSIISTILSFGINAIVKKITKKQEDEYLEYIEKNKNKLFKKQQAVVKRPTITPGAKL